jgi:hypothetical protein
MIIRSLVLSLVLLGTSSLAHASAHFRCNILVTKGDQIAAKAVEFSIPNTSVYTLAVSEDLREYSGDHFEVVDPKASLEIGYSSQSIAYQLHEDHSASYKNKRQLLSVGKFEADNHRNVIASSGTSYFSGQGHRENVQMTDRSFMLAYDVSTTFSRTQTTIINCIYKDAQ